MDTTNVVKGTPTPVFLRAKPWVWKFIKGPFALDIPYSDILSPETGAKTEVVSLALAEDISTRLDLGALMKVLFSKKLYPSLEDRQVFAINDILLNNDTCILTVVGNVIEQVGE